MICQDLSVSCQNCVSVGYDKLLLNERYLVCCLTVQGKTSRILLEFHCERLGNLTSCKQTNFGNTYTVLVFTQGV